LEESSSNGHSRMEPSLKGGTDDGRDNQKAGFVGIKLKSIGKFRLTPEAPATNCGIIRVAVKPGY
jgi:hypothetical protein